LPEGLEYLKNSWEGTIEDETFYNKERIFKYNAKIKISHVDLKIALKKVSFLLAQVYAYDTDVEFKDCPRKTVPLEISILRIFPFVRELKITGCYLTYEDLCDLIRCGGGISKPYCLSGNNFVTELEKNLLSKLSKKLISAKEYRNHLVCLI
jgi:hypothetical protein